VSEPRQNGGAETRKTNKNGPKSPKRRKQTKENSKPKEKQAFFRKLFSRAENDQKYVGL
jgi:hypothetical protein